ncbi:MAG: SPOR domain-containing protein [Bacteroidales bacterium]|nr:SPOR domain-containing protein [Candidatus Liminaster caballi]
MKKILFVSALAIFALSLQSCKSQKTLSEATTVADPASEVTEVAPIKYTNARPAASEAVAPAAPATPAANDRTEKVTVVDNGDSGLLKGYNVIVGTFGSKTNAEAQKAKMISRGYKAFLVQNAGGMFRVVAASFDTREAATAIRDVIRSTYANEAGTCAEAWLLIPQQ